ncbi:MAG: putative coenzyme hydrogenase, beta subunit [Deltaproteobacteria bacterium]|jgi:coenzyme F420 hydrogenase subunit beta|nr:putative coenzyme hydrogenase, beta subunit [Deltaproteobacteria bacterium]
MRVFGAKELLEDVHAKDLCIGCGACVSLCPYFKNYRGKTAMLFPCTLPQGRCHAYCPRTEVDLNELSVRLWDKPYRGEPIGIYKEIVASRSTTPHPGCLFQAGGTVSALISFALKEKIINAAALTDREDLIPIPRLVTNSEEVLICAGSKFMASPTVSALNEGIAKGFIGMGIVGTPCQMMAVLQLRSNPLGRPDFRDPVALSIGLFCNWSLDTRQFSAYLTDKMDITQIRGMDIPPPPADVMVLKSVDRERRIPLSEIRPFIPSTCFVCPDMTSEFADLSVGMYEGRAGWNTLIVRSQRGADLVEQAVRKGVLQVSDMQAENLERLSRASAKKKERALRMLLSRGLLNAEGDGKRSVMRIPPEVVGKILATETE